MEREKCAPDDPRRCIGTAVSGQCPYLAAEGEKYCERHLGSKGRNRYKQRKIERYLIDQQDLAETYSRQMDDLDYLDIKEEIILVQTLLQHKINSIGSKTELITSIPGINSLVQRLESMKLSMLKMQKDLGKVLGKEALRELVKEIATILDEELVGVPDKGERIERIADRIVDALDSAGQTSEDLNEE